MSSSTHSLQLHFLRSFMGIDFLEARKRADSKPLWDMLIIVNGIKQLRAVYSKYSYFFFLKPCDDFSLLLGEQSHNERDHCLNLTCIFFVFMITWGLP